MKNFLIVNLCLLLVVSTIAADDKLSFLIEMTRHGARAPVTTDETYNVSKSSWPDGAGELTSMGIRQHYLLGTQIRKRYIEEMGYLSDKYDSSEIFVLSTYLNRTIMSAYSQLQGTYPEGSGPTLTTEQIDRAVPPRKVDDLVALKNTL
jgi:hypothetical protein